MPLNRSRMGKVAEVERDDRGKNGHPGEHEHTPSLVPHADIAACLGVASGRRGVRTCSLSVHRGGKQPAR